MDNFLVGAPSTRDEMASLVLMTTGMVSDNISARRMRGGEQKCTHTVTSRTSFGRTNRHQGMFPLVCMLHMQERCHSLRGKESSRASRSLLCILTLLFSHGGAL